MNLIEFFTSNFENCVWLAIILVALCPTLEGKIAIPLAMNVSIWGNNALSPILALLLSFLGAIIPCYPIILLTRNLKNKTTGFLSSNFLQKYYYKSNKIENKSSTFKKYLFLTGFVAVPLPLTGVWSGSLIAGLTNLNIHYSCLSIMIGTIISNIAITILCSIFTNSITYILIISLIIIISFLFIDLILSFIKIKKRNQKQ